MQELYIHGQCYDVLTVSKYKDFGYSWLTILCVGKGYFVWRMSWRFDLPVHVCVVECGDAPRVSALCRR
jgi:hypothetical protein